MCQRATAQWQTTRRNTWSPSRIIGGIFVGISSTVRRPTNTGASCMPSTVGSIEITDQPLSIQTARSSSGSMERCWRQNSLIRRQASNIGQFYEVVCLQGPQCFHIVVLVVIAESYYFSLEDRITHLARKLLSTIQQTKVAENKLENLCCITPTVGKC